jgi:GNAT superfamily N-acetyltransferase
MARTRRPQATVAQHLPLAARYLPDVAPFAALPDDAGPDAWDALRELIGPGGMAVLPRAHLAVPDAWSVPFALPCRQMLLTGALAPETQRPTRPESGDLIESLGPEDVPEMIALVERTRPGPFLTRTIELGTYLGVRDERKELVAMAGERMHLPDFTEISAVCTDDTHRGRGLASRLVRALVHGIRERDETPCLHLTQENEGAHRVYDRLGFETRALFDVTAVRAPE